MILLTAPCSSTVWMTTICCVSMATLVICISCFIAKVIQTTSYFVSTSVYLPPPPTNKFSAQIYFFHMKNCHCNMWVCCSVSIISSSVSFLRNCLVTYHGNTVYQISNEGLTCIKSSVGWWKVYQIQQRTSPVQTLLDHQILIPNHLKMTTQSHIIAC